MILTLEAGPPRESQSKYIILYMQMIPIPLQPNSSRSRRLGYKREKFSKTQRNKIYSYYDFFFHFGTRFSHSNPYYYSGGTATKRLLRLWCLQIIPLSKYTKMIYAAAKLCRFRFTNFNGKSGPLIFNLLLVFCGFQTVTLSGIILVLFSWQVANGQCFLSERCNGVVSCSPT